MALPHVLLLLFAASVDALRVPGIWMQAQQQDFRTREELRTGIAGFYGELRPPCKVTQLISSSHSL